MNKGNLISVIDPAFFNGDRPQVPECPAVDLMPGEGEYAVAIRKQARLGEYDQACRMVPDELFLHLYAYEMLERMREQEKARAAAGPGCDLRAFVLPFWPECLFQAAGIPVHGAREVQALFTPGRETYLVIRTGSEVADASIKALGELRFDADLYCDAVASAAKRSGWKIVNGGAGGAKPCGSC